MASKDQELDTRNGASNDRHYRGDGFGETGINSDKQPDLKMTSGVHERHHGFAAEAPMAGDGPSDNDGGPGRDRPS